MTDQSFAARLRSSMMILALVGTACSCGPPQQPPRVDVEGTAAPPAVQLPEMLLSELGQLQVFITGQTTDGRNIKLRGLIRNPYSDPVEGVRVIFRMLTAPSADARELDRVQKVLEEQLASGEQTALRLDVQTMYAGQSGMSGFSLQAFAIKRGGQVLPPPPGWKE